MKIERMAKGNWDKVRAYFDLNVEGLIIKGFKLMENPTGELWVSFPSNKKDEEYQNTVYGADQAIKDKVRDVALEKYKEEETVKEPF